MTSDIVDRVIEKYKYRIDGELVYCMAYMIAVLSNVLTTTMFTIPSIVYTLGACVAIVLALAKVLIFDKNTLVTLIGKMSIVAISALAYKNNGNIWIVCWAALLVGAMNVSFDRLMKIYLIITISVVGLAVVASFLSVIVNLRYDTPDGIRNSFGIVYPTDFASHIFFIIATMMYKMRDNIKNAVLILFLILDGIVFYYCKAKLDCQCILILVMVVFAYKAYQRLNRYSIRTKYGTKRQMDYSWVGIMGTVVSIVVMTVLSLTYGVINYSDKLVSKYWTLFERFRLSKEAFTSMRITLFGQYIKWVGSGGTVVEHVGYNFVDCSYFKCLYDNGVVFTVGIMILIIYCCKKMKRDLLYQLITVVLAINYMISHHMLEVSYNIFFFVAFATMTGSNIKQKEIGDE